ncbi:MAG: shikimate kinase [Chloroflexota bacterium]
MSANIVLIRPSGTGKSTIAQLLSEGLDRPMVELDQVRWNYYNEIGYDADYAQQLRKDGGMKALAAYWKPFDIHAVERVLSDYPSNTIISFGAGHSVYEDQAMLEQAKRLLANHTVILLIPSPKVDESVAILGQRILAKEPHLTAEIVAGLSEINRFFLEHPSNYALATITIFTQNKQPIEISQKIIELVNSK